MSFSGYKIVILILLGLFALPTQALADDYVYDGYKKLYASKKDDSFMFVQPPVLMRGCKIDSDCAMIAEFCGSRLTCQTTAINKKYVEEYYLKRDFLCKDSEEEFPLSTCKGFNKTTECTQGICTWRVTTKDDMAKRKLEKKK